MKHKVFPYTADGITENMRQIEWKKKWKYLKNINFPILGKSSIVGI